MPFSRLAAATTPTAHIGLGLAAVGRPGDNNIGAGGVPHAQSAALARA
ncbi:aldo/keto reductase, partial [Streptomyces diastatochromogenes]